MTTNPASTAATPKVRATAKRLGVNLAGVTGTGAGGRISVADVKAAAPPRARTGVRSSNPTKAPIVARATPKRDGQYGVTVTDSQVVHHARQHNVDLGSVQGTGPGGAVTSDDVLTAAGFPPADHSRIPPFTASGMDPRALLHYPGPTRAAIAAAPTLQDAYAMAQRYAGMSDAEAAQALAGDGAVPTSLGGCEGNWP